MSNPYFNPDLDDDVFSDDPEDTASSSADHDTAAPPLGVPLSPSSSGGGVRGKHRLDGQICGRCGVPHDISSIIGKDWNKVGLSEQRRLQRLIDELPDALVRQLPSNIEPAHATMIESFFGWLYNIDHRNVNGPMVRAIFDVLNQMTNGLVTQLWRAFEAERRLIVNHTALKSIGKFKDDVEENESAFTPENYLKITNALNVIAVFVKRRIAADTNTYRQACANAQREPIQQIIDSGTYPEEVSDEDAVLMARGFHKSIFDMTL